MNDKIIIKGAREHNLKNVDLEVPKNKLVVFTGISGSGKSSMAFDTIYAEGQRRYVESLSSYARQFLGVMGKPDVDFIEGLSPSISIDQKSVGHNPRSTVGTITEIYDYLRLLYAKIGHPFCPNCGTQIARLSVDEITDKILVLVKKQLVTYKLKPQQFTILSPVVRNRKGEFSTLLDNVRSKGFSAVIIDKKNHDLSEEILLIKTNKHDIDVIIDTFSLSNKDLKNEQFTSALKSRIFNAVEQSLLLSDGLVILKIKDHPDQLFSEKFTCATCGLSLSEIEPRMFSFNSPVGACPRCKGLGFISTIDKNLIINPRLSIDEGAILPFSRIFFKETWYTRLLREFMSDEGIDTKMPIAQIDEKKIDRLLFGNDKVYQVDGTNRFGRNTSIWEKFIGIIPELQKRYFESESDFTQGEIQKYMTEEICDECLGRRLKPEVLSVKITNLNIYDVCELSIETFSSFMSDLNTHLTQYERDVSKEIIKEIYNRLSFLKDVGLTYLTLNRQARTLSGGESQRIRLASQIGSGLTGVIYVLDEPSIGLHARDVASLVASLKNLRKIGNTVIVVEHDPETIREADHIIDFGLYAGKRGGKIVFEGSYEDLKKNDDSLTANYLSGKRSITKAKRGQTGPWNNSFITISGCRQFNLKNVTAKFPLSQLICVTGVSGSGKSTLVVETLYKALAYQVESRLSGTIGEYASIDGYQYIDKVYLVDQAPIGKTPRSNPATYVGLFDHVREVFSQSTDAKMRGYKKGRFSFNVKGGRCEKCQGAGTLKIEMQFLPDVYVKCDVCTGRRYNSETLEVKYKDKNIFDVLNMTVDEAHIFFEAHPLITARLKTLKEVGLGYIELGQPAPTLSGGEAQRVKLAFELAKKETGRTFYVLDEPTTGLHLYDVEKLLSALYKLVERGNTVVIIEHNLDVIKNCDYIIDMGPDGGDAGGFILYQGLLEPMAKIKQSHTAYYLKKNNGHT